MRGWVNELVARYKRLRRIEALDALPRTPAGKLLRRKLRDSRDLVAPV